MKSNRFFEGLKLHIPSFIRHSSFVTRNFSFFIIHSSLFILLAGCSTTSVFQTDKAHPSLEMDGRQVKCNGEIVSPYDVPKILEQHHISHDTRIYIRVNQIEYTQEAHIFRHVLARAGYSHTTLVTKEHAEAWSQQAKESPSPVGSSKPKPRIRYRSANEE